LRDYGFANPLNPVRDFLVNAQQWRDRAEEARTLAAEMGDEFSRQQMLAIADGYDRLAKRAEARTKSDQS
jgi:hypothetical protein